MYYVQTKENILIGAVTITCVCKNCYHSNSRVIENTVKSGSNLELFLDAQFAEGGKDWVRDVLNIAIEAKKDDWVCFSEESDELDERINTLYSTPTTQSQLDKNWEIAKNTEAHTGFLRWAKKN